MSMPTDSPARLTGREYVDQYLTPLMAQFNVAREHVDVSYLAATSQVRLVSREFATTGEAGKFINEKTFGYLKQDLAVMFPAPLLYVGPWPVTYRTLVQSLRDTYGLVIEEGEFTLSNGLVTVTPNPDTEITLEPPVTNGTFTFTATAASLRFRAGTAFRLLVHTSTGRVRLNALYDLPVVGRMAWLSNNADETAAVNTLVLSEGRSCVRDLFVRAYGYLPPESQIDTTFDFSNGRCVATVRGRDREVGTNAIGKFAGAATMEIERIKISSIISAPLNIDGTYSMSYEAFKRFMLNSFGLRIEDGEFYIGSDPLKQPLGPGSTVSFSPDANNQDRLVATSTSLRFLPEDGFTMRLIYAGEFVVIGNVPTYTEGETIDFQYALRGGFPPYNLLDVVGLPSTITLSQTGRLQGTAPAGSYPVIARYNDRMNSVAYLNDTIVVEVADVTPEPTEGFQMLGFRSENGSTDLTPLPVPDWTAEGNPVIADGPLVKNGKVTLDGASYLKTGLHEIFDFGTDDFTFEFSVDYTDLPDTFAVAMFATANAQLGDPDTGMAYMYAASEGLPPGYSGTFLFGTSETGLNAITSTIPLPSGRTKISITRRNGTDLHLFYNEQQAGVGMISAEVPINFSKAQGVTLGAVISSTDVAKWKGDIYDMRVIKGLALYLTAPVFDWDGQWYDYNRPYTDNYYPEGLFIPEWDKLTLMEYFADGSYPLIVNTPYDHQRVGRVLDIRANQTGHTMTYSPKHDAIFMSGYFGSYLMYGPSQNYRTVSPNGAIYDGSTGWARTRWIAEWDMFVGIDGASLILGKSSDGITWTQQDLPARSSTYPSGDSIYAMDWDPIEKRLIILQSGGNVIEMRTPTQMTVLAQHPFGGHQGDALHWSKVWNKFVFVKFQGTDVGFFTSTDAVNWTKLQVEGVDQAFRFTESTYFNEVYITSSGRLFRWSNGTWRDITPTGKLIDRDTYPVFDEHNQALWLIFTGANPGWKCTKKFDFVWDDSWTVRSNIAGGHTVGYSPTLNRMVVGDFTTAKISYSDNVGQTWTAATVPSGTKFEQFIWSERLQLFIGCGLSSAKVWSPDGITWTQGSGSSEYGTILIDTPTKVLAFNSDGAAMVSQSADGKVWSWSGQNIPEDMGAPNAAAYSPDEDRVVVAYNSGRFMFNNNALPTNNVWTRTGQFAAAIKDILWSADHKAFFALVATTPATVMRSPNGRTDWEVVFTAPAAHGAASRMAYSSQEGFLLMNSSNTHMVRADRDWVQTSAKALTLDLGSINYGLEWIPKLQRFVLSGYTKMALSNTVV